MKKIFVLIISLLFTLPAYASVPENLLLKSTPDKILAHKEIDWQEKQKDGSVLNKGKIISYDYITDTEVKGEFLFNGNFANIQKVSENNFIAYIGDHFFRDGDKVFLIKQGATTTIEAFISQTKVSFFDKIFGRPALATDYYAGAGDGDINGTAGATWALARSTSGSEVHPTDVSAYGTFTYKNVGSTSFQAGHGYFPVDLTALSGSVSSASLFIKANTPQIVDGTDTINLIQTSQADYTTLATSDFTLVGNSSGGSIVLSSVSASSYFEIPFNETGLGWITLGAWNKFGIKMGNDFSDDTPPVSGINSPSVFLSEQGAGSEPYYSLTIAEPSPTPTPTPTPTPSPVATSTIGVVNGFTYDGLLTNFFLFLLMIGLIFGFIFKNTMKK